MDGTDCAMVIAVALSEEEVELWSAFIPCEVLNFHRCVSSYVNSTAAWNGSHVCSQWVYLMALADFRRCSNWQLFLYCFLNDGIAISLLLGMDVPST